MCVGGGTGKKCIFTNFKMKILKADFFSENGLLLNPF